MPAETPARFALISDVHGNLPALEAVLADITACGPDVVYCLGDLVGYGPWPAECVELVRREGIETVRGNYDDGVARRTGDCGCYYSSDEARSDGAASYAFTDAALGDADRDWLAALPQSLRLEAGGLRVLLAHGSPRKINEYLMPDRPDSQLVRLAREADADLVCVGHVHIPYRRHIADDTGTVHYVNAGSVGKPKDGDPRACWVEVVVDHGAVDMRVHRVAYDVERTARAILAAGLPDRLAEALRRA